VCAKSEFLENGQEFGLFRDIWLDRNREIDDVIRSCTIWNTTKYLDLLSKNDFTVR
jgi:hypothetical protein